MSALYIFHEREGERGDKRIATRGYVRKPGTSGSRNCTRELSNERGRGKGRKEERERERELSV